MRHDSARLRLPRRETCEAPRHQSGVMPIETARTVVTLVELYALTGIVFAVVFLARGIARVDPRIAESPSVLRLLILPGVTALWPLFAWRWIAGAPVPVERNAHRDRAGLS